MFAQGNIALASSDTSFASDENSSSFGKSGCKSPKKKVKIQLDEPSNDAKDEDEQINIDISHKVNFDKIKLPEDEVEMFGIENNQELFDSFKKNDKDNFSKKTGRFY